MARHEQSELTTEMLATLIREGLESVLQLNEETYYEGLPDSANEELLGVVILPGDDVSFSVRTPSGRVYSINVERMEDAIHHFHPTYSDPENGPSEDDIPDKCFCDDPDADTTVDDDKCPACIRHRKEGIGPDGSRTADGSSDPDTMCSWHYRGD